MYQYKRHSVQNANVNLECPLNSEHKRKGVPLSCLNNKSATGD